MTKQCEIHLGVEMTGKEGKYGYFYSHLLEDGTWCNGKKKNAPYAEPKKPVIHTDKPTQYAGQPKEFWDKRSRVIALCGLANSVLAAGGVPDIATLSKLLTQIETKAEEMTLDENGPGF
jgi:hypothetical protein